MSLVAQLPKWVINALHQLIDTTGRPEVPVLVHERVDFFLERLLVGRSLLRDSQWGRRCGNEYQNGEHLKTSSHVTLLHQSIGHHFGPRRSARSDRDSSGSTSPEGSRGLCLAGIRERAILMSRSVCCEY